LHIRIYYGSSVISFQYFNNSLRICLLQDVVEVGESENPNKENQNEDPDVLEHLDNHSNEGRSRLKKPQVVKQLKPQQEAGKSNHY